MFKLQAVLVALFILAVRGGLEGQGFCSIFFAPQIEQNGHVFCPNADDDDHKS